MEFKIQANTTKFNKYGELTDVSENFFGRFQRWNDAVAVLRAIRDGARVYEYQITKHTKHWRKLYTQIDSECDGTVTITQYWIRRA